MSAKFPKCLDCNKLAVPKGDWPRLKPEDLEKVCRCLVKIDPKPEPTPAASKIAAAPPVPAPALQIISKPAPPPRRARPDYLVWVMGFVGLGIFVYGVAFFLLAALEFIGRSTTDNPTDSSTFFLRLYLSFAFMGGGAVVYLLAKISHLIWKGQNWRA